MLTPSHPPQVIAVPLTFVEQDLQPCNTLGLSARALTAILDDEADIPDLHRALAATDGAEPSLFVLGGGSNVVMDARPRHRVLRVALQGVRLWRETATHWIVEAAAGESWHGFVSHCLAHGWPGLENLALIPGTVGAAPVQNIGAYGVELADRLHSVVAWNLQVGRQYELSLQDCQFAYRDSLFKRANAGCWLIVRVRVALPKQWVPRLEYPDLQQHPFLSTRQNMRADVGDATQPSASAESCPGPTPIQIFEAVCEIRRRKLPDPAVLGNAGSFFKNPLIPVAQAQSLQLRFPDLRVYPQSDGRAKLAAGWLIEHAGWKGKRLGPVGMHERQALVLVNHGGATTEDVLALAGAVRRDVQARFGVELEQEPVWLD
ncbi:MAG: UDP-N-acetylmuramate dehydrogenase [Castellaniella sp.]|uniref:UDP-N-acetylmuramate dehydrogenase n=1 Tax=Castellaniella sp. TaxID=1955812 RepID=UPI0011F8AB4A|nr:UDP-N-acetylmuramate dehydrogenase [Castellaniella sp.]TAN29769.1 MAG: UDP-N-acetylmuramate dehydrogenase [Castellaniella sp.]